jgi:hypothetical protein
LEQLAVRVPGQDLALSGAHGAGQRQVVADAVDLRQHDEDGAW